MAQQIEAEFSVGCKGGESRKMSTPMAASTTIVTGREEKKDSVSRHSFRQPTICYEGEILDRHLTAIKREIAAARKSDISLPEKFWLKQQFSVGVNEVTLVLERMPPIPSNERSSLSLKIHSTRLQVILIASDCHPRLLTKHVESLASLKKVPVVFVKDKKRGSLRLGELVKLKTAIVIGVKVREFNFKVPVDIELDFSNFKCVIWYAPCRIKGTSLINLSALKYSISLNDYIAMRLHIETLINSVL